MQVLAVLVPVLQALAPVLGKVLGDIIGAFSRGEIDHDTAVKQMHDAIADEAVKDASFMGALKLADDSFAQKMAALRAH